MEYITSNSGVLKCIIRYNNEPTCIYNIRKECIRRDLSEDEITMISNILLYRMVYNSYGLPNWVDQLVNMECSKYSR